jgi:hypothetical protein
MTSAFIISIGDDYNVVHYGPFTSRKQAVGWAIREFTKAGHTIVFENDRLFLKTKNPYYTDGTDKQLGEEFWKREIGKIVSIGTKLQGHIWRDGH